MTKCNLSDHDNFCYTHKSFECLKYECYSLRKANEIRQEEWEEKGKFTLLYYGNALAGEVGEACNVIKKLEREKLGAKGSTDTVEHLAEELADVVIYCDLLAAKAGINLDKAIKDKFNKTSEKYNFRTRFL